jgi:uncharacterized membrane protein YobD (UPF0266 family)
MCMTIEEHSMLWSIAVFFIIVYLLYDKYKVVKFIGDTLLYTSLWYKKKIYILLFAIPPIIISILYYIDENCKR